MRFVAIGLSLLLFVPTVLGADGLTAFPPKLAIRGSDDAPQLLITGGTADQLVDLSGSASYAVVNSAIVRVDPTGRVYPLSNGATEIKATVAGKSIAVPVTVEGMEAAQPINFANQIEPILTKLSCNSGGCHGKASGQNGFKLSLLGFDPEVDFMSIVKEGRGRRMIRWRR